MCFFPPLLSGCDFSQTPVTSRSPPPLCLNGQRLNYQEQLQGGTLLPKSIPRPPVLTHCGMPQHYSSDLLLRAWCCPSGGTGTDPAADEGLSIFAELQLKESFQRQFPEFGYGQILVRRKNVSMKNMNVPFEKTQLGSPTNTTCNAARGFLIASPS